MLKDTLKAEYKVFDSFDEVIDKSNKLKMYPRLFMFLKSYGLLNDYIALKVKPSEKELKADYFVNDVIDIIKCIIKDVKELHLEKSYVQRIRYTNKQIIHERTIEFICSLTGLKYTITRNEMYYMISGWTDKD